MILIICFILAKKRDYLFSSIFFATEEDMLFENRRILIGIAKQTSPLYSSYHLKIFR